MWTGLGSKDDKTQNNSNEIPYEIQRETTLIQEIVKSVKDYKICDQLSNEDQNIEKHLEDLNDLFDDLFVYITDNYFPELENKLGYAIDKKRVLTKSYLHKMYWIYYILILIYWWHNFNKWLWWWFAEIVDVLNDLCRKYCMWINIARSNALGKLKVMTIQSIN